jgi:hypothetical protein
MARVHYPTNAGQAWAQREAIGGDARLASEMPILLKSRPQSQSTAWAQWHCTVDSGQWPGTVDSGRHSPASSGRRDERVTVVTCMICMAILSARAGAAPT